jgi:23S rRNA (pseudouridine1915-N3)-methyltransferase
MIKVIAVGRIKERYVSEGITEFTKRLGPLARLEIVEIKDSNKEDEAEKILKAVGDDFLVALDVSGKQLSSEEFAVFLKKNSDKKISFVIGGPEGLSEKVLGESDYQLSISKMTFTHEMCRLFLLEQIYRGHMILSGRSYHK